LTRTHEEEGIDETRKGSKPPKVGGRKAETQWNLEPRRRGDKFVESEVKGSGGRKWE